MCGITAFFARESSIDRKHLDTLFSWTEKRGKDGFGFVLIKRNSEGKRTIHLTYKDIEPYSKCKDYVLNMIQDHDGIEIGDLIIGISRAAPETEPETDPTRIDQTLQPIVSTKDGLAVVHNGAVMRRIHQELIDWAKESEKYQFTTDIDSESILAAYIKYNRNMKDTFEYLSGGFASIIYDEVKDMLYVVNDHMQISHGYIRGLGFFLHSDNDAIGEVIYNYLGATRDGMFIWENFYHHFLDGGAIREIDLQSGFMRKEKYMPRYIVGDTFDSSVKSKE